MDYQQQMFSVHDAKANAFLPPFLERNSATAIRRFEVTCQEAGHDFHRFAEDYTLFHVGHWDEENGLPVPLATPHPIIKAIQVISAQQDLEVVAAREER